MLQHGQAGLVLDKTADRLAIEHPVSLRPSCPYRLQLREDNADLRLTATGRNLSLIGDERWTSFCVKRDLLEAERERLRNIWVRPQALAPGEARRILGQELTREQRLADLLRRPETDYFSLLRLSGAGECVKDAAVIEQLEIEARYAGYIDRQRDEIERQRRHEDTMIPEDMDYPSVRGLSHEVCQILTEHQPLTLGHAGRLSGMTPAAVSLLLVHLKRRQLRSAA